ARTPTRTYPRDSAAFPPQAPRPPPVLRRLDGEPRWRRLAPGNPPERFLDLPQHGLRLEVADRHDDRVVRHVVRLVEGTNLGRRDPLDVLHPTDDRKAVGMRLEGDRADFLAEEAARVVLGP